MKFLASVFEQPWFIILILLAFFGAVVLAVILLKKKTGLFKDEEGADKSEAQIAKEEVDRILEDVDDPQAAKEMAEFKQEEAIEEAKQEEDAIGEDKPLGQ